MSFVTRTSFLALALVASAAYASQTPAPIANQQVQPLPQVQPAPPVVPVAPVPPGPPMLSLPDSLSLSVPGPLSLSLPEPLDLDLGPLPGELDMEALESLPMELQPLVLFTGEPQRDKSSNDPVYSSGMKAMDEGRWSDAVSSFDKVAGAHGDHAEAALYWKAYSLEKLGKKSDANAACAQLQSSRPSSSWNHECLMLDAQSGIDPARLAELAHRQAEVQIRMDESNRRTQERTQEAVERANERAQEALARAKYKVDGVGADTYVYMYKGSSSHDPDEDIKLIALNSLMQQEPAKALPALKAYILSNHPLDDRRHALFVLSRSKSPEAQALLTEIATSKTDPELQRAAVQTIAVGRGKQAGPDLVSIYRNSQDKSVKRAALSGLFIARDASDLVDLARSEKDMDMKREIVSQLALMHDPAATAYMEELLK